MTNSYFSRVYEQTWSVLDTDVFALYRFIWRFSCVLVWPVVAVLGSAALLPLWLVSEDWLRRSRRRFMRFWVRCAPKFLGTRIKVVGKVPESPFFMVGNHISWIDFFVTQSLVDAVCVTESLVGEIPLVGWALKGLGLIVINRVRGEVRETNNYITQAMLDGENIVMAPEATVSPGRKVCKFHSSLLDPAVRLGRPVHHATLTVQTPEGWPPPSRCLLTPDPDFPAEEMDPDEEEITRWGQERGFLTYAFGLLSLPYHEYTVTFGEEPIGGTDRKQLAHDLHKAVQEAFEPVD